MSSNTLYKYRKFDEYGLRILENKELYFSSPESLNDPLDCQWPIQTLLDQVIESIEEDNLKSILSKLRQMKVTDLRSGKDELKHRSFEILSKAVGILSLSYNPTDALLWSHYADGHRGFCIGFDKSYLSSHLINNWKQHGLIGAEDVKYVETPPFRDLWIKMVRDIKSIQNASDEVKKIAATDLQDSYTNEMLSTIFTTKFKGWKYECEFRAIRKQPGNVTFPPSAIKEIIFGLKSSETDQKIIRALLTGSEWSHVRFRRPEPIVSTFALKLVDC